MNRKKIKLLIGGLCSALMIGLSFLFVTPKAAVQESQFSVLDISNMHYVTYNYHITNQNNDWTRYHEVIVKNGVFGYESNYTWSLNLDAFQTTQEIQDSYAEHIYSPYGLFYQTDWTLGEFMQEMGDNGVVEDTYSYLEYCFITPMTLDNVAFGVVNFSYIEFYDSQDTIIYTAREFGGYFSVSLSDVYKIRAVMNVSDILDEPNYIYSSPRSSYNVGYLDGYNSRQSQIDALNAQITQLENANDVLQQQISTISSGTNANQLIWTIASVPFESFKQIWNVDVLGLNISGFVLGILLGLIVLYIIKKVW